jgi:hypothetical protein
MDQSAVASVNGAIERVRRQIGDVERRASAQDACAADAARKQAAWAGEQLALDEEHADRFVHATDALEETVARKDLQRKQLDEARAADARRAEADAAELDDIAASVAELRRTLDGLPAAERAAGDAASAARMRLERCEEDVAAAARRGAARQGAVEAQVDACEGALGMVIGREGGGEGVVWVFKLTCVNPRDVAREHCVRIQKVAAERKFVALSATPALGCFAALAAAFDEDQCLATLVQAARRAFKELYAE